MQAISILLYELDLNEVRQLPAGLDVLQYDTRSGFYETKITGRDNFPAALRFKFFLFEAPPLPKLAPQYVGAEE